MLVVLIAGLYIRLMLVLSGAFRMQKILSSW